MSISTESRRPSFAKLWALMAVVLVIAIIELGRRIGTPLPVPYLFLLGALSASAALAGARVGMVAAVLSAAFVIYSDKYGLGPKVLDGSLSNYAVAVFGLLLMAIIVGRARDRRVELTEKLEVSQSQLLVARNELAATVDLRTNQLQSVSSELSSVRNRLDSALLHSPAGVLVVEPDRTLVSVNPAALRQMGISELPEGWRNFSKLLENFPLRKPGGEKLDFDMGPLNDALEHGTVTDDLEFRVDRPDGSLMWIRCSVAPVIDEDDRIVAAVIITLDTTEQRAASDVLKKLSNNLMTVQEDERAHLARELHDEVSQHLAALNMGLHAMKGSIGEPAQLAECIGQVDALANTVKNLSAELRPSVLDDLGLVAAVRWYLARQRQRTGHGITFDANVAVGNVPLAITTASFRVVQEAVTNAINHSGCNALTIRLYNEDGNLHIEVSDDGRGFDMRDQVSKSATDGGLGLLIMNERVSQLGGEFEIDSEPGRGTKVLASFPLR